MDHGILRLPREAFPQPLLEIPQPPEVLFVRGVLPSPEQYLYLCVVGSRAVSQYGIRACMSLIAGLAGKPICIVSGLALGTDAEAHKAALAAGLPTVAVLPSGADDTSIYPSSNRALAERILKTGGALVSEYAPGEKAAQWTFPARNRIMAGLSRAVLIIEASERSGTLITARLALDYNRDVLCVPHPIGTQGGAGNNRLIRTGAALIRSSEDILEALGLRAEEKSETGQYTLPLGLTEHESAILLILSEPLVRDEIIERSGLSAQHANIALSSLDIRGLIIERLGKIERA